MTRQAESRVLRDERCVLVRTAGAADAEAMGQYIRDLGRSTPYILTFEDDVPTVESIRERLAQCEAGEGYTLLAIDPESAAIVAGTSYRFGSRFKLAHTAELGTGVLPGWQGVGLGSWMLDRSIEDMRKLEQIRRLELTVMSTNTTALEMYKRAGFVEEGKKFRSIRQPDGSYCDEIIMAMWVGEEYV